MGHGRTLACPRLLPVLFSQHSAPVWFKIPCGVLHVPLAEAGLAAGSALGVPGTAGLPMGALAVPGCVSSSQLLSVLPAAAGTT